MLAIVAIYTDKHIILDLFTLLSYRLHYCDMIVPMNSITTIEAYTAHHPTPELCLLAAVIQMALRDLQQSKHRDSTQAFIESTDFAVFCEWLEWDADVTRSGAAEGVAVQKRWYT